MNEREHNELMKKALTSGIHWQAQTSTPEGVEEMREWLNTALKRVRSDGIVKQSEWSVEKTLHRPGSQRYRDGLRRYQEWRASSQRFASMVQERLDQLPARPRRGRGNARGESIDAALARAQAHGQRMSDHYQQTTRSLIALARAVESFANGETTINVLVEHLDRLSVPQGDSESKSLRTLLSDVSAAKGPDA